MSVIKKNNIIILLAMLSSLLSGCMPELDMQGHNPKEYYKKYPIKNHVLSENSLLILQFSNKYKFLRNEDEAELVKTINDIRINAVSDIEIRYSRELPYRYKRVAYVNSLLKKSGHYENIRSFADSSVPYNQIIIEINHLSVLPPKCPDWRKSPVTNYTNTPAANWRCASTVNLGLMIDNPRDLIHGQNNNISNSSRAAEAIKNYYTTEDSSESSSTSSSSSKE